MSKKIFCFALCAMLLALSFSVEAQQAKKIPRIGYISRSWTEPQKRQMAAFKQGMRELGYVEGQNYVIEYRSGKGESDRIPPAAAELVRLKVDVIVTSPGNSSILAALAVTSTIPIVMGGSQVDPVKAGYVVSLARPGGNLTGLTDVRAELHGKMLEILKETFPRISRVAILWSRSQQKRWGKEIEAVGQALGIQIRSVRLNRRAIESGFPAISQENPDGLLVAGGAGTYARRHGARIIDFAMDRRLPAIYLDSQYVDAGGLMSYGTDVPDLYRQAATYVDKILKGAKPADLPIEQPTKFNLTINLKTAKALGITIPPEVLYRATKVIK
ncbi:MAG: ABC transporter substrate-binding protein [Gammaproteobacteria bacterium]